MGELAVGPLSDNWTPLASFFNGDYDVIALAVEVDRAAITRRLAEPQVTVLPSAFWTFANILGH